MIALGKGTVLGPNEGTVIDAPDTRVSVKVTSADTGGAYSVAEYVLAPHTSGAVLHLHRTFGEFIYVVTGELVVYLGARQHTLGEGASVRIPKGTIHMIENRSPVSTRVLVTFSPAGVEGYFEEVASLYQASGGSLDVNAVQRLLEKYDKVVFGPPRRREEPPTHMVV